MDTCSNYKNRALASLHDQWASAFALTLVYFLIGAALGAIIPFSNIILLPMGWAVGVEFLELVRGSEITIERGLIRGYKNDFVRIFVTMLLCDLFIIIGTILFIIPGIYVALALGMVPYILRDNPELKFMDAITASWNMMKGHKMELLILYLSFIGWIILSIITLGIGFLLLSPYIQTTVAHFYEDLKAQQQA